MMRTDGSPFGNYTWSRTKAGPCFGKLVLWHLSIRKGERCQHNFEVCTEGTGTANVWVQMFEVGKKMPNVEHACVLSWIQVDG